LWIAGYFWRGCDVKAERSQARLAMANAQLINANTLLNLGTCHAVCKSDRKNSREFFA
jgi:hypothetical protein